MTMQAQCYTSIGPKLLLDVIAEDPTSDLAQRWRRYVRQTFMPSTRKIADAMELHAAVIELPPKAFVMEKVNHAHLTANRRTRGQA
eukprot:SAG31_NODE_2737_length_5157_cov_7.756869_4_plen_86_part_00